MLKFNVWAADDVRAMAVCRVGEHKICMTTRQNTVFDELMGPISYLENCATCGSYIAGCTGHCKSWTRRYGDCELLTDTFS